MNKKQIHLYYSNILARFQRRTISAFDIMLWFRQLATLLTAGIPLIQSLEMIEKSQHNPACRILFYSIKKNILSGQTLFMCLQLQPKYFDELTCHMIQIGEHTGKLDFMLVTIAEYKEKQFAFIKRMKQALFYPCLISITALTLTFIMFAFVVPKFADLFRDSATKLPLLTRVIFSLSTQLQQHLSHFIILIGITFFLIWYTRRTRLKKFFAINLKSLPVIASCFNKILWARFAHNLAITFAAGLPILDALQLTANSSSQLDFKRTITELRSKISTGLPLFKAMAETQQFPTLMIQMVKVGEEAGTLEYILKKIAELYEADVERTIAKFSQLLEPLLMLLLGVLIGGLVIGMYLPIFNLGNAL